MAEAGKANLNMDPPPYTPPSYNPQPYNPSYVPPPVDVQQVQYAPYPAANQPSLYPPPPAQGYPVNPVNKATAPAPHGAPVAPQTHVIVVQQQAPTGNCPVCRTGNLTYEYTCCGIALAILFFPIGILCCLLMKQGRCTNCGSCH